jgi:hypothetical protein
MTNKQIAKIFNEGACIGFKENAKNEFYLKKYQGASYILVFEKHPNGDKIKGCLAQDDFLLTCDKIQKIFNEIE